MKVWHCFTPRASPDQIFIAHVRRIVELVTSEDFNVSEGARVTVGDTVDTSAIHIDIEESLENNNMRV